MQICRFCGRYVEDEDAHNCSAKQKLIQDLRSRMSYLEEQLERANLEPNSKFMRSAQNLKDLHSRISFLKEQLEKANLDPDSKLLRNAQNLPNDPMFQNYEDEFSKNREIMDKKIQELREKFNLLNSQYGEKMLNLPSELAEVNSPYNKSFAIPINKVLLGDGNVVDLLKEQSAGKSLRKFLDYYNLVNERLDQVKEHIDMITKIKENTFKSLDNKLHTINLRVEEGFSNSELIDRFNTVRLKPIESRLEAFKAQDSNLIFENEIEKLEPLKDELNHISGEIEFIITILLMDENNVPLSTLGELNPKQRGLISDDELNIKEYLRNTSFLEPNSIDNQITGDKDTKISGKTKKETFEKLENIRSALYVLREDAENHQEKNQFDIDCDSAETAQFFCEFIRKNCPDSRGILVTRVPDSKTTVINFSNCKNKISIEIAELFDLIDKTRGGYKCQ